MADNSKEKPAPTNPRTFLISSIQLTDIMRYLMSKPYAEVVKLMSMLTALNQLDPKLVDIGTSSVKQETPGVSDGKK